MNKFAIVIILLGLGLLTIPKTADIKDKPVIIMPIQVIEPELNPELVTESPIITTLKEFMERDTTSDKIYSKGYYDCGHFARDLSKNASSVNIKLGSILLHNDAKGQGYGGHAMNYVIVDNMFYIINPESDFIMSWEDYIHRRTWKYYKLYPEGHLIPTKWKRISGLKPIEELENEI